MYQRLIILVIVLGLGIIPADVTQLNGTVLARFATGTLPFLDPLPIPTRWVVPQNQTGITVRLTRLSTQLYKNFPSATEMWGYNESSPGPVIEVEKGQLLRVHWKNELPNKHLFPEPYGLMNFGPIDGERIRMDGNRSTPSSVRTLDRMPNFGPNVKELPEVRNITHLHGAAVWEPNPMDRLHNNDGWPDAWNIPGQEQIAEYPNEQSARALWYHDHAIGETGRNVAAGLLGMYLIRDEYERSLHLPSGKYEIPLIFQALGVNSDGSLFYTDEVSTEFFGNAVAINGKILPYLEVEPRKYRFRMLNGSNSRMLGLKLVDRVNRRTPGPAFYQIGTDSGFLEKTAILNDPSHPQSGQLFLASAERADVVIDFSAVAGKSFVLTNSNAQTDPDGELPIPQLMLFKVGTAVTEPDLSSLPMQMKPLVRLREQDSVQTRRIEFSQTDFPETGSSLFEINKRAWIYRKSDPLGDFWDYEITDKPKLGTAEVWELINTTVLIHPFHLHASDFQVLDRRPFNVDHFKETGEIVYTGPAVPPAANEAGWKDVVRSYPREVTRIITKFGPYPGYYMYHCHLLEHEDMDMMIPFQIEAAR